MKHLIFDYETLSVKKDRCPIVCLALMVFDDRRFFSEPYTMDEIRKQAKFYKFNIADQVSRFNRQPNRSTLEWWKSNVDKGTQKRLLIPREFDISIELIPSIFREALEGVDGFVIARGLTFDPIITYGVCEQLGEDVPWPYWKERDSRSLIDGVLWQTEERNDFIPKDIGDFSKHDPIDDIALDILRLQTTQRILAGED